MVKFLPGVFLVQLATAVLVFALMESPIGGYQLLAIGLLGLVFCVLAASWFASIAGNIHKDAIVKVQQDYAREREDLLVNSERQKVQVIQESHQQILKETNRAHGKANLKVGAMFAAAVGAGALMLFAQFITVGLLVLTTTGGALTGYIVRARQESNARKKLQHQVNFPGQGSVETIERRTPNDV